MSSQAGISFWRVAGMSYNQYCAVAQKAFKNVLKEEAKKLRKTDVEMKERAFAQGKAGEKSEILDIFTKNPFAKSS